MTTVVVPLDESPAAEQALPFAVELTRRRSAELLLVSAVELPVEFTTWMSAGALASGDDLDALTTTRATYLSTVAARLSEASVDWRVLLGGASAAIIETLESLDDPLLVMTSHGRTGAGRLLLGSVASRVVHAARCPVLLTRVRDETDSSARPIAFQRLLVPLDGSPFSERALQAGVDAIGHDVAELRLLRVVEIPALPVASMAGVNVPINYGLIAEYVSATRDEATEYLQALNARLTAAGQAASWELREGDVGPEINAAAHAWDADAVVMATHGRSGFNRLFFGSVAERVLHNSERPVLLMAPKAPAPEAVTT
jgi:nucleotide-binding universal stress UspA family protein